MKVKVTMLAIVGALGFWGAGQACAQNQPRVQITKPPVVQSTTGDSATIKWSTNLPSGTTVRYGTDPNNLSQKAEESWGGTNHSVTLKGLQSGTTYYFQVISGQGLGTGTAATSNIAQFTTRQQSSPSASAQNSSPAREADIAVVVGPTPQDITDTGAQIAWNTNSASSTILKYGTDAMNLAQTAEKPWGAKEHKVQISGLQPNTQYHVSVQSEAGRELARNQFRTLPSGQTAQQFQISHGPVVESLGPDSVVIAWTTSAPSSSVVMYGSDPNSLNQRAEAPWGQQTHRVTVKNLQPDTKYWFQVQSGQAQGTGQMAQSHPFPVTTQASGQSAMEFNPR
jgi:phosphodiesterase/alkaline phosphatase D-like protein